MVREHGGADHHEQGPDGRALRAARLPHLPAHDGVLPVVRVFDDDGVDRPGCD